MGKAGMIWVGWKEKEVEARIQVFEVWIFTQFFFLVFFGFDRTGN